MRRHEAPRDWHLLLLGKTLHFLTADRSGEAQCPQAEEQKKKKKPTFTCFVLYTHQDTFKQNLLSKTSA